MGRAYMFKCQKCGHEYEISVGVGFRSITAPHDELYVCQCCGKWKVVEIPSLIPIDNVSELDIFGSPTYKNQFKCNYCGNDMEEVEYDNISFLSCPECGTENETSEITMWD